MEDIFSGCLIVQERVIFSNFISSNTQTPFERVEGGEIKRLKDDELVSEEENEKAKSL